MKICLILLNKRFRFEIQKIIPLKNGYAPLTLALLAAQIPQELNAEIQVIDEGISNLDETKVEADLVAISVLTPMAPRAYELCNYFRKKEITVVLGGIHVSLLPEEAARYADSIVVGYSENSWQQLLRDFSKNSLQKVYAQDYSSAFTQNFIYPNRNYIQRKKYLMADTIEISRGCVNHCKFCVIPVICKRQQHYRPIADVLCELKMLKCRKVAFLDSSPNEDKAYMKQFLKEIIPLKLKWYGNTSTKIAEDTELLNLMQESGCKGLLVGFESLSEESLAMENKSFNKTNSYSQLIEALHHRKITVLGSFMFGLDGDKADVFAKTYHFIQKNRIEIAHLAIYTPFPGTPDFQRLEQEGRILTKDWQLYDGRHVVFQPKNFSKEFLQTEYYNFYKNLHSWSSILRRNRQASHFSLDGFLFNLAFKFFGQKELEHLRGSNCNTLKF